MKTKLLGDKKITVRKLKKSDLKRAKEFQQFINSLVKEKAKILMDKPATLKEEIRFLESVLRKQKKKTQVFLFADCNGQVAGLARVESGYWSKSHIARFDISVRREYRKMGLGEFLMEEIIKLAKKELKTKPKIIQFEVYVNNKPAINLYKKMGFKIVARLPKQVQYHGKLIDEFVMIRYV